MGYNWNPSVTAGVTMLIPPGGEFGATFVVVARVRMASEEVRTRMEEPVPVSVGPGVIVPSPVVWVGLSVASVAVERTRMDSVDVVSAGNGGQYEGLLDRELGRSVPLRMSPSTSWADAVNPTNVIKKTKVHNNRLFLILNGSPDLQLPPSYRSRFRSVD